MPSHETGSCQTDHRKRTEENMAIQLVSLPTQTEHLVLQEDDRDVLHLHVKLTESCLKAIEKSATVSCVSNDVQLRQNVISSSFMLT